MAISSSPWFAFSSLMRSNEDMMIAKLKESYSERQNTYLHQVIPWSSQALPQEYPIVWRKLNQTKQDILLFASILFQDHYILRYMLSRPSEQNLLFAQVESMFSSNERDKKKILLANNNTQQYRLSEEYINTYVLRITDALLRIQDKYIYLSLNQQSTIIASAHQEPTRGPSQEKKRYRIQLPKNTFRSFFSGKSFQKKNLFASVALNIQLWSSSSFSALTPLALHQHSSSFFIF